MRKVLMWAVGVPFLVFGMVVMSFGGSDALLAPGQPVPVQGR